jgi:hypothetical protein
LGLFGENTGVVHTANNRRKDEVIGCIGIASVSFLTGASDATVKPVKAEKTSSSPFLESSVECSTKASGGGENIREL